MGKNNGYFEELKKYFFEKMGPTDEQTFEDPTLQSFANFYTQKRTLYAYNCDNPEMSDAEVKKLAATISAYPGTSEHELGLAVDFNSVETTFESSPQFQWLKAHAADYGFILRYTKEKQSITGVIYEPWHYRYVGENHAKKINQLGYCLEEYIDYLKNNK